jgi:SAM-dependent methyltransferase
MTTSPSQALLLRFVPERLRRWLHRALPLPITAESVPTKLAAVWIAPVGTTTVARENDRANLLGAAHVACNRLCLTVANTVEGRGRLEVAADAARWTGTLVIPATEQVLPELDQVCALIKRAQAEGWRLLQLDFGADSMAESGVSTARLFERLAVTHVPDSVPTPPAELRRRVSVGGEDIFRRSGLLHVRCFADSLARIGVELDRTERLLEWGAGSGRMTTHLANRATKVTITAVDPDPEAMRWVARTISVRTLPIAVDPPMPLEDDEFDLVIGHSVLSHLNDKAQDRWLEELARVTRPGGHAALSINGHTALTWHLNHPLVVLPSSVEIAMKEDGIAVWRGDGWQEEFYDDYHTTFHDHLYIRSHWSQWFDIVDIHSAAAEPMQDIVILRAR